MTDWDDRVVDSALHELAGRRPPDLSARILITLDEQAPGPLPRLQQPTRSPLRSVLLAAALMLLGMAVAALGSSLFVDEPITRFRKVEAKVLAGAIELSAPATGSARQRVLVRAGEVTTIATDVGARVRTPVATTVRLGVFPTLLTAADTELEVRSMEFSMKNGVVAAASLTLGVVAGIVTWNALDGSGTAVAGETVHLEAEGVADTDLAADNARLLARIQQLERENRSLLTLREEVASKPVEAPSEPVEPATAEPVAELAFSDDRYRDVLKDIDWKLMGETTLEMQPLMNELVRALEEDGEIPPELAVKIEQLNANLIGQVPALLKAGLPGRGPNGAYTHPLVVSNILAKTLQAAGKPLDQAQSAALSGLVKSFGSELDSISAGQFTFEAEQLQQEIEAKNRFYKEMSERLTPEQFASIYPKGSTEFDGLSLFGSGLLSRTLVRPVRANNASEFARRAGARLGEVLKLNDADTTRLRSIIESVSSTTPGLWDHPASAAESKLKMMRRGRTTAAMRNQVAMLREISRQMSLTAAQQQELATLSGILVPLPVP
ncbi:MAG: hypothetical protein ACE37K_15510 [Planctomycetota bacterium]